MEISKILIGRKLTSVKNKEKTEGKRGERKPCRTAQLSQTDKRLTSAK